MQCRYLKNNYCEYFDEILKEQTEEIQEEEHQFNIFVNCFNCMVKKEGLSIFGLNIFIRSQLKHLIKRKGISPELMREFLEVETDKEMLIRFIVKNSKWFNQNNIFVEKIFEGDNKCFIFHHEKDGENYYGNKNNIVLYENMKIIIEKFQSVTFKTDYIYITRSENNNTKLVILFYDYDGNFLDKTYSNMISLDFGNKSALILNDTNNDGYIICYDENNNHINTSYLNDGILQDYVILENEYGFDHERFLLVSYYNKRDDYYFTFIFDYNFNCYPIKSYDNMIIDNSFFKSQKLLIINNISEKYKTIITCYGKISLKFKQVFYDSETELFKIKYKNKWWNVDFKHHSVKECNIFSFFKKNKTKFFHTLNDLEKILTK